MTRDEVANICKAMSDSNRLKIIEMLTQGEKCGCNKDLLALIKYTADEDKMERVELMVKKIVKS